MRVDFTREELLEIRGSIGALADIAEEELRDPRNRLDPSFNRAKWERQIDRCLAIIDKITKVLGKRARGRDSDEGGRKISGKPRPQ